MRKAVLIITVAMATATAIYVWAVRSDSHDFSGKCLDCHLTVPEERTEARIFVKDISSLCLACHDEVRDMSHPVDMRPSFSVPSSLPLDWKNEMTCVTCHYAHQEGLGDYHLRGSAGGEGFCGQCHADLEATVHKGGVGAAHIVGDSTRRFVAIDEIRTISDVDSPAMDELSFKCLTCHDAVFANDSLVETRQDALGFFHNANGIGLSHPIGVYYEEARRRYFNAYRAEKDLPPQIRFFDGMVGCGSCHNPYAKDKHTMLVMSNNGSALCLACHRK